MSELGKVCEHGSLRRKCDVCLLTEEVADYRGAWEMLEVERDTLLVHARVLRDHVPEVDPDKRTTPLGCAAHDEWTPWPCEPWTRAKEAVSE